MEEFYTYLWLRENGTPYYVGKGKDGRAFYQQGHRLTVPKNKELILVEPHCSEEDAFEAEKFLISFYGRIDLSNGCLRNLTDGGEGVANSSGPHVEKLINLNISRRLKIPTKSALKGRKHRELKASGKASIKGSPEYNEKMKLVNLGRKHSDEKRANMGSKKGIPKSQQMRDRLSQSRKGIKVRPFSEEHRRNISAALVEAHARRKRDHAE